VLRKLIKKMGSDHAEVTAVNAVALVTDLDSILTFLKTEQPKVGHWTKESAKDFFKLVCDRIQHGDDVLEQIEQANEQLKSVRSLELNDTAAERRRQGLWLSRMLKAVRHETNDFPGTLVGHDCAWLDRAESKVSGVDFAELDCKERSGYGCEGFQVHALFPFRVVV
jgi:hypothetical protein